MSKIRKLYETADEVPQYPPETEEEYEKRNILLAMKCAEKQLRDGTASAQVICHYLDLATARERIKRELLEKQRDLATAKTEAVQAAKKTEELYEKAIEAMKHYGGNHEEE